MIYIVLFIYYVFLALLYDVGRYRRYRRLHFFVSLALMILVSGLRYRVGSDTVVYMDDFKYYPDRLALKAHLSSVFAVISPEKVFSYLDVIIKEVPWEKSETLRNCFEILKEL